jgi:hypothetical protein
MARTATDKSKKTAQKAITRDRAQRRVREMQAREPAETKSIHPTRDIPGLQKIARLMSGVANRAASAYADARIAEGDKFVRIANAGYHEAMQIFEQILKAKKVLAAAEQEELITVMNNIKLLHIRVQDYNTAGKDEAWRREHLPEWNPHPLGEDRQGFFAKERF